ncbi:AsnC family transcriptional regulator [Nocardia thailandica]
MESVRLDAVDRGLLHALQVDGRAPFRRIGEVLDVSDRTVARRFARLRAAGLLRVTAIADPRRTGAAEWLIRLVVRPGAATAVARALARRADTSWVTVLSGGTEVTAMVRVPGAGPLPLDALSGHAGVVSVAAQRILRPLTEAPWHGRASSLDAAQVGALTVPVLERPEPLPAAALDRHLFPALAMDGRTDIARLARLAGWSESAVRRRLEDLRRHRALRFDVEIDAGVLGFGLQALLWLTVAPAELATVAAALATHREVAFACAVTGAADLVAIVVCRDAGDLVDYVAECLGALPGVEHVESAPVTAIVKRAAPVL